MQHGQAGFILGIHNGKSINANHHTNRLKKIFNYLDCLLIMILIDAKKAFDKMQYSFKIKLSVK